MLERVDRLGFVSGQALGFVLLGLTSVYREGFETGAVPPEPERSGTNTRLIGWLDIVREGSMQIRVRGVQDEHA
jgi:hypothetical protein